MALQPHAAPHFGMRSFSLRRLIIIAAAFLLTITATALAWAWIDSGDEDTVAMTLTMEDQGSSISLMPTEEFVVRLESNVTTGYQWSVETLDVNVVTYLGSTYFGPADGLVGQGGEEELRFRALAPGETEVTLRYWQPWSGDASIVERFTTMVVVVED